MLDQAVLEYETALSKERSYSKAMIGLGNIYYRKGVYEKAERYYVDALKIDKDNPYASNNLAWIFISKGVRLVEAERLAIKAVEKDPKNRAYYLETLALAYYKMGRFKEALKKLDEAGSSGDSLDERLSKTLAEDKKKILESIEQSNEGKAIIKNRIKDDMKVGKE